MKSAQPKNQTTNFRNLMFITPKSDFSLSLQIYKTNTKFLLSKMDQLNAKSCPEIGRVNKPLCYEL